MPEGPYGFPRITNIGPFSELEGKQEYTIEQGEPLEEPGSALEVALKERDIIQRGRSGEVEQYHSKLIFREQLDPPEGLSPFERIKHEVDVATRDKNVARADWLEYPLDGVGVVGYVEVKRDFQRRGIGKELKRRMVEHMVGSGLDRAFTLTISDAGESLARDTGFEETDTARDINAWRTGDGIVLERRF